MNIATLVNALAASDDWGVFTEAVESFPKRVKSIKLTAQNESGSTALSVVKAKGGAAETTGELGLHVLEPMQGITAVTAVGAGVAEFRVYYE